MLKTGQSLTVKLPFSQYLSPNSEELGYFAKRVVASKTKSGPRREETVLSSAGVKAREASSG